MNGLHKCRVLYENNFLQSDVSVVLVKHYGILSRLQVNF
jgi:hypothetical protein